VINSHPDAVRLITITLVLKGEAAAIVEAEQMIYAAADVLARLAGKQRVIKVLEAAATATHKRGVNYPLG
jgi:hypothetical protein